MKKKATKSTPRKTKIISGVKKKRSQAMMEEDAGPVRIVKRDAVRSTYDKKEVDSKGLVQLFADAIEQVYEDLGVEINRANAVERARILAVDFRYKLGIHFWEDE